MRILILGAGTVGSSVAEMLFNLHHEVTMVDNNPKKIQQIDAALDVTT
ncbi:MAG: NAD-binding protein, partial [Thermoguttaceae bacterium]